MRDTHLPPIDTLAEKPDLSCLQQASEWYALLKDENVSHADRNSWQAWLDESDAHRNTWQHVESISQRFAILESQDSENVVSTIQTVRNARTYRASSIFHERSITGNQ